MAQTDQLPQQSMGMLSGASPQQPTQQPDRQAFNEVIEINGDKVQVVNGILDYDGDRAFVSDDGSIVVMPDGTVIGRIINGKFADASPEYIKQLQSEGVVE